MRMLGYYAFHTFINQIRKLFKTWVLILLVVCLIIGGIIGGSLAVLTESDFEVSLDPENTIAETDADGNLTGRVYDEEGVFYYQLWDVEQDRFLFDSEWYDTAERGCIVSTDAGYETDGTGRQIQQKDIAAGENPNSLTDQSGTLYTRISDEKLDKIKVLSDEETVPAKLKNTLYLDENEIIYVLLQDETGRLYVLPFVAYWQVGGAYDALLDYEEELEEFRQVYPEETEKIEEFYYNDFYVGYMDDTEEVEDLEDPEDFSEEEESIWDSLVEVTDQDLIPIDEGGCILTLPTGQTIDISPAGIAECVAFLVILALLVYYILSSGKNGGKIFMMADVNFLFASPMKPQSVLLFRLVIRLGVILIWAIYFGAIYCPQLLEMGVTLGGECLMLITIALILGYGLVLQVLLYTLASTNPKYRKIQNLILAAAGIALLAGYTVYWKNAGLDPLPALLAFLRDPKLRWLPLLGWGKAAIALSFTDNYMSAAIWIGILLLGLILMVVLVWHLKVDFYEDAMAKSEEVAAILNKAKETGNLFTQVANKKKLKKAEEEAMETEEAAEEEGFSESDPSMSGKRKFRRKNSLLHRLASDGLDHGWGPSVYFWKALHVRFRFGSLVYFTKTATTYLVLALVVSLFGSFVLQTDLFLVGILAIGVFAFYRCLGNALQEDIDRNMFCLLPGSPWSKIFYSLLGILTNSLLDLIPAYLVLLVFFRKSPESALGWIILTLSLQMYAIAVGAFMDVSIPINAGTTIKQTLQVIFIYLGLVPDALILLWGFLNDRIIAAAAISFLINLALTLLFITLTANILSPHEGSEYILPEGAEESMSPGIRFRLNKRKIRHTFSRLGWGALIIYGMGSLAQILAAFIAGVAGVDTSNPAISYALTFLPLYLVGFSSGILFLRKLPVLSQPAEQRKDYSLAEMIRIFCITVFFGYTGAYLAQELNELLVDIFGHSTENVLSNYISTDNILLEILFLCILAPCLEEFFFRKILIDHTRRFGEKNAVLFSALIFGLFHGNLTQFIYASAMGLVLGYLYLRTEKLRYSISLHMAFNFLGSVIAGEVTEILYQSLDLLGCPDAGEVQLIRMVWQYLVNGNPSADPAAIHGIMLYLGYLALLILIWFIGLIFLIRSARRVCFYETEEQIPEGCAYRTTWLNPGVLVFTLLMLLMMILIIAFSG